MMVFVIGDGKSLRITRVGNSAICFFSKLLQLNDILFVPEWKENLLSIAKLTRDNCGFYCFPWLNSKSSR